MHRSAVRVLAAVAALTTAAVAQGQVDDHLKCYGIKDPLDLRGLVDLDGKQFGLEEKCRIGEAELFCVPVTKRVRKVFDGHKPIDPIDVFGPPAPGDRICYRIECSDSKDHWGKSKKSKLTVTDQFGSRHVRKDDAELLCTPAFKGEPPATRCQDTFPLCGGACATGGTCQATPLGCDCVNVTEPCFPQDCSALSDACNTGVCNETLDTCVKQPKADGTACDDGQFCTVSDACASGACVGGARDCSALSNTCNTGVCNETLDTCAAQPKADGTACDDGQFCTVSDACASGACVGGARDCSALSNACNTGVCNETLTTCAAEPLPNGTSCGPSQTCSNGVCQ
jgi:hypothetical protein